MTKNDIIWQTLGLFSVPLIKIKLGGHEKIRTFIYDNILENEALGPARLEQGHLTHFHSGENIFNIYHELAALGKDIEKISSFAYHNLLNYKKSGPMKITGAWINLSQIGATQVRHSHANCRLSGTYYLNTDKNTSIRFSNPTGNFPTHAELHDSPDFSKNEFGLKYHFPHIDISVESGECLLWPSHLLHGYENNQTPDRLTLSFNCMPETLNSTYQVI